MARHLACALLLTLALGGCVAKTAFDVVTAPVRVAGKAVDLATTSQSEADEKRGREIRRREERLAKLERDWRESDEECREGDAGACGERDRIGAEIDALLPTIPYEPERR
jgi:hypothetical protein